MRTKNIFALLILTYCAETLTADEVLLQLPDGPIKGRTMLSGEGNEFYSFQGIPYAAPPINELRFQAPQPVEPWEDVIDATHEKNVCYQVTNDRADESEDCLFINVFTPAELPSDATLPVMFFIYGGGFIEGTSEFVNYGPQHFMDYGVILVTFNYRVGPFGFFSTGDDAIPGNAGLKDQAFALQWLQKNIEYFGGDPDKVTIFGESAGSASVGYQLLSPLSKGLFRAAIGESGSSLSPWAYQRIQVQNSYTTASYIDSSLLNASSTELLEYLQSIPASDIDQASYKFYQADTVEHIEIVQGFSWAPIVEHEHEGAFITKKMFGLLSEGDINRVPLLIGMNSEESLFNKDNEYMDYIAGYYDEHLYILVPEDMHIEDADVKEELGNKIKQIYAPNNTFQENNRTLITYFSDQSFARSIIKHAELQSEYTDVYFYQFSYSGVLGGQTQQSVEGFSNDVRHGEEMAYIFCRTYSGYDTTDLSKFPEQDQLVFKRFITLFTNFAKYLVPTPEEDELLENLIWPTVNATSFEYVDVGSYFEIRQHPKAERYSVWESLYEEYGQPPYDTY